MHNVLWFIIPICFDCGVPGAEIGGGAGTVKLFKGCPCNGTLLAAWDSARTFIPGAYVLPGGIWATGGGVGWLKNKDTLNVVHIIIQEVEIAFIEFLFLFSRVFYRRNHSSIFIWSKIKMSNILQTTIVKHTIVIFACICNAHALYKNIVYGTIL